MERIIKVIILLIAFIFDMWIWNSYADTSINKVVFIVVFITAPLIWGILMDIRADTNGSYEEGKAIRKLAPHIMGVVLLLLTIITEITPLHQNDMAWKHAAEIILFTGVVGFLWNLVIRDLEIG